MESAASLVVRVVAGALFAGFLGFFGMVAAGMVLPPTATNEGALLTLRLAFIGAGAAVGALSTWLGIGDGRRERAVLGFLIVLGGLAGAAVALVFADAVLDHPDPFKRVQQISRTTVLGGAAGANLLPLLLGALKLARHGRL